MSTLMRCLFSFAFLFPICAAGTIDLSQAIVVVRPGPLANAEKAAAVVLIDEIQKRSGIRLRESTRWPVGKKAIAITSENQVPAWSRAIPVPGPQQAEGYRVYVEQ